MDKKIKSGYRPAENRMVHHGGSFEYFPAFAWALIGDRRMEISSLEYPALEPHELEAKCVALLQKGYGWSRNP